MQCLLILFVTEIVYFESNFTLMLGIKGLLIKKNHVTCKTNHVTLFCSLLNMHCVKVSKYGVFSGPYLSAFGLNTERYISPYSIRMRENTDQKKLRIWTHFTQWWRITFRHEFIFAFIPYFIGGDLLKDFVKSGEVQEKVIKGMARWGRFL